jgi:hypothetical protein
MVCILLCITMTRKVILSRHHNNVFVVVAVLESFGYNNYNIGLLQITLISSQTYRIHFNILIFNLNYINTLTVYFNRLIDVIIFNLYWHFWLWYTSCIVYTYLIHPLHIHTTPTHLHTNTHEDILSIRVFTNVHQYGSISVNKNDFVSFVSFYLMMVLDGPKHVVEWLYEYTTLLWWRLRITFLVINFYFGYLSSGHPVSVVSDFGMDTHKMLW